jgi:hypothetical protein
VPISGLPLQLPAVADNLPGTDKPTVAVAVDANGRFYFANQIVTEDKLKSALKTAVQKSRVPLTLVIHADKTVTYDQFIHLTLLRATPASKTRCSPQCRAPSPRPPRHERRCRRITSDRTSGDNPGRRWLRRGKNRQAMDVDAAGG